MDISSPLAEAGAAAICGASVHRVAQASVDSGRE
jgi:hypothetical protein